MLHRHRHHSTSVHRCGELVLLRKPGTWFDVQAQLRAIDDDLALVRIIDKLERVCIAWLLLSTVDSNEQTLSHAWSSA
jgi:hypothetical protein